MAKRLPGLRRRSSGVWVIDKRIEGIGRVHKSCRTKDRAEAERYALHHIERLRRASVYGERIPHTFEEAAAHYVDTATHKSLGRDITALNAIMPHIGQLDIMDVHDATLAPYVKQCRRRGLKSGTVRRNLATVRSILTLCARKWRDESGRTWMPEAPLLEMPDWNDKRRPRPLSWEEQALLLPALPEHVARAALFAVNTGIRSGTQCELRWEWEQPVAELGESVFVVPAEYMKGGDDESNEHVVVLNKIARSVIESCRGEHPTHVFSYGGRPLSEMQTPAFERARVSVGLGDFRWHDWRHTFARRLRAHRVSIETRKTLLGHADGDITTHYSAAEIGELIDAVSLLEKQTGGTLLRAVK